MNPLSEILLKEKNNEAFVYLYPYQSRAWIAYEQSAIHLNRLLPNISMCNQLSKNCEAVMVIDILSLEWLFEKLPPLHRSVEHITLQMPEELLTVL